MRTSTSCVLLVTDVAAAVRSHAPQLWPEAPGNIALDSRGFGGTDATRAAVGTFAGAAHVARVRLVNQRIVMAPMEPRGALARYDRESGRYHPVLRLAERLCAAAATLAHSWVLRRSASVS